MKLILLLIISFSIYGCSGQLNTEKRNKTEFGLNKNRSIKNTDKTANTLRARFSTPQSFVRIDLSTKSYGNYLRNIKLTHYNDTVQYYNGEYKINRNVYCSVIDQPIGTRDLQQCADAVMRLRSEYLFKTQQLDKIHFNFLSDGKPRYFKAYAKTDYSYRKFLKYMDYVFAFANTSSLYDELKKVESISDIKPGDVFIQKGKPYGHAVTVMDVAINGKGNKVFLLSQSYMPAQETQILINPNNKELSPWYEAKEGVINTPEWVFSNEDLRRF